MLSENEPEQAPIENAPELVPIENVPELVPIQYAPELAKKDNRSALILVAIFLAIILLTTCVLVGLLINRGAKSRQSPTQAFPVIFIPTTTPLPTKPVNQASIHLPVILSVSATAVSANIWKVTKIESLGYKSGGQRSDLATFKRIDSQDSAQGYCINQGWPTPKIGAEYSLNPQSIFVPLQESKAHPVQRFQKIQ